MGSSNTREFRQAVEKISDYLRKLSGSKQTLLDQSNAERSLATVTTSYATIPIEILVIQPKGRATPDVILSSAMAKLPQENLVAFFRQLLVWNNLQTEEVHFGLNDAANQVFVVSRRPFEGFDYSEFKHAMETISAVNRNCVAMLRQSFRV